jgi:hypothetical protein
VRRVDRVENSVSADSSARKKADSKVGLLIDSNFSRAKRPRHTETTTQPNYFFGAIASFAAFATRNFTTVFALI